MRETSRRAPVDDPELKVQQWPIRKRMALYERARAVEAEMRSLVGSVVGKKPPDGFDPLDLLKHPKVGADLERLGREWFRLRALYWSAENP